MQLVLSANGGQGSLVQEVPLSISWNDSKKKTLHHNVLVTTKNPPFLIRWIYA